MKQRQREREREFPSGCERASGVPFCSIRVIDRSGGGRFNGEAKVAQTRENRIPASEHRRLKLLRFRVEIQRVAKSCLQTGALAREHDKLCRQKHERRTGNERGREREREREGVATNY